MADAKLGKAPTQEAFILGASCYISAKSLLAAHQYNTGGAFGLRLIYDGLSQPVEIAFESSDVCDAAWDMLCAALRS